MAGRWFMGWVAVALVGVLACSSSGEDGSSAVGGSSAGGAGGAPDNCSGVATPCALLSDLECISQLGCSDDSSCSGVSDSCFLQSSSVACNAIDGCHWDSSNDECDGFADSCSLKFSELGCVGQPGCSWSSKCSGVAMACDSLPTSLCASQSGCYGGGGGGSGGVLVTGGGTSGTGATPSGGGASGGGSSGGGSSGTSGSGGTGGGCPGTQTLCYGACVDLATNQLSCGACGVACNYLDKCVGGQCVCASGLFCDGWCVAANDPKHCGACGNACPLYGSCQSGNCSCATGALDCSGTCVNVKYDSKNCGACGKVCGTGQTCSNGTCQCPGAGSYCPSVDKCVDTIGDKSNCGACGVVCPGDAGCFLGKCLCTDSSKTACGTSCVNTQTDPAHCGGCNFKCPSKYLCAGTCQCPTPIVGTPVQLTSAANDEGRIAAVWDGTHVGLLYAEQLSAGFGGYRLKFALLNPDGTRAVPSDVTVTATDAVVSYHPALATNGSGFLAAWTESGPWSPRVTALPISASGVPGTRFVVGGTSAFSTPAAAWSSKGGDYVVVYNPGTWGELAFRHLGTTGVPYPPVTLPLGSSYIPDAAEMAEAPDGSFQIVGLDNKLYVLNVDSNGTLVGSAAVLGAENHGQFGIVHDGAGFLKTWVQDPYYGTSWNLRAARTGGTGWPLYSGTKAASEFQTSGACVALGAPNTAALAWTTGGMLRVKRFSLPASVSATLPSLSAAVTVAPLGTVPLDERIALVRTGNNSLLVIWPAKASDGLNLWAAPLDLQSCP